MDPEKKSIKQAVSNHITLENIFIGLAIILGIVVLINIFTASAISKQIKEGKLIAEEKLKPAKIELTAVKNSKCTDCFDISTAVSHIKNANANVTKENSLEFDSKDGRELVKKYGIRKVPSVIIKGEIEKISIQGLEKNQDALIFTQISPPFTNVETGKIEGRVILYYLKDSKCENCNNLTLLINQIKAGGVKVVEENGIEPGSDEGKQLINKYKIEFVPTIVLSEDAGFYELITQAWPQVGNRENNAYVFRGGAVYPAQPFINLTTGKLIGIVDIVYLADKSCEECYDVNEHKDVLAKNFGIKFGKEETYDINDAKGREFISRYNITKVPTVILSEDTGSYPSSPALKQFFSVEKDNSYVFRSAEALGTYRDLARNEIVKAEQVQQ